MLSIYNACRNLRWFIAVQCSVPTNRKSTNVFSKEKMKLEIFFPLYLALFVRLLSASATCPHESRENSTFGMEIPIHGSKYSRLCLTFVEKDADNDAKLNKTTTVTFDDMFAGENYCKANYKNGRISNYESIMLYANRGKKTLNDGSIVRLLTSDQYVIKSLSTFDAGELLIIKHTTEDVLGRTTETEFCGFDGNMTTENCNLLLNIDYESIQWALSHMEQKIFCQITTIRKGKDSVYELKSSLVNCKDDSQWDGYFCIHEPYQNCKFYGKVVPCHFQQNKASSNNDTETTCITELRYFSKAAPEVPYGKSCPANEVYPCNCSSAINISEREIENLLKMMDESNDEEMDSIILMISLYNIVAWSAMLAIVCVTLYKKYLLEEYEEASSTTSLDYDVTDRVYPIDACYDV
ncbi:Leucine--tRNA ligase [Trichinella pseudospiralis]